MPELFLGVFAVVLLLLFLQKLEHAETKILVATLKWTLVGLMLLAGIYLTLVGRLLYVAGLIVLLTLLLKQDAHQWIKKRGTPLPLSPPLSVDEAARLLKVDPNAAPEEILKAFEEIKEKDATHKDCLRQARDVLLKHSKK